ncbi:MAG: hypothetical protein CMQ40_10545 [Gammaproteobacteria bacterium]|nr:hypothetical protein [Gammaproteobacteria bacterium]|tara:strand:- start:488 stop:1018 length:531 start_codon:yes stop_codon:yes gene_type:complete
MPFLIFLCVFFASYSYGEIARINPYPSAKIVDQTTSSARSHMLVLGALEKVDRDLRPEDFKIFSGRKLSETYYLPEARNTAQVFSFYRSQLELAGELVYWCEGRSCGSSSYWANKIFDSSILYGPEQYQAYGVFEMAKGVYFSIYVAQRATRKIYVHLERFLPFSETVLEQEDNPT